jgi:hypothetical protein
VVRGTVPTLQEVHRVAHLWLQLCPCTMGLSHCWPPSVSVLSELQSEHLVPLGGTSQSFQEWHRSQCPRERLAGDVLWAQWRNRGQASALGPQLGGHGVIWPFLDEVVCILLLSF